MIKSIIQAFWRSGGATGAGALLTAFSGTPWGMILTPVLMGLSKGIKKYYEVQNEGKTPAWVGYIPF